MQLLLGKHWFSSILNGRVIRIKKHMWSFKLLIFLANLGPLSINTNSFYFYKGHAQWVWKSVMPINLSICIDEHIHNCHLFANQCHFFFHNANEITNFFWNFGPFFLEEHVAIILSKMRKKKFLVIVDNLLFYIVLNKCVAIKTKFVLGWSSHWLHH